MIGLSTLVHDSQGARLFRSWELIDSHNTRSAARRVTRTPTLDGGVSVYDTGYAPGDRSMGLTFAQPTKELVNWLKYIVTTYGSILVVNEEGAFLAVPEAYEYSDRISLKLLITEELT